MRISLTDLTNNINNIITETHNIINALDEGGRIKIPELAERVSERTNNNADEILGTVNYFVHNIAGFDTKQGRTGGVYKIANNI